MHGMGIAVVAPSSVFPFTLYEEDGVKECGFVVRMRYQKKKIYSVQMHLNTYVQPPFNRIVCEFVCDSVFVSRNWSGKKTLKIVSYEGET